MNITEFLNECRQLSQMEWVFTPSCKFLRAYDKLLKANVCPVIALCNKKYGTELLCGEDDLHKAANMLGLDRQDMITLANASDDPKHRLRKVLFDAVCGKRTIEEKV